MAKRKQPYRFGVPAKYLEGLSDDAARKRAAEREEDREENEKLYKRW